MKMIKGLMIVGMTGLLLLGSTGCQTTNARVVTEDEGLITTVGTIDIQDWEFAADTLVQRLLTTANLKRGKSGYAVMAVSTIVNNTTNRVDTSLLTKRIRVALNQGDLVRTSTVVGIGGGEDAMAGDMGVLSEMQGGGPQAGAMPDYTLSGKLVEVRARAGSTRQSSFVFQLSLTETATGLAIWEGEERITKQGKRNAIGA